MHITSQFFDSSVLFSTHLIAARFEARRGEAKRGKGEQNEWVLLFNYFMIIR